MFLRFTKGKYDKNKALQYRKSVLLGDTLVMEYGDKIIGTAQKIDGSKKSNVYEVCVAKGSEIEATTIARYIKDMIGKSVKFTQNTPPRKRRYIVKEIECDSLPIKAEIVLYKMN